MTNNTSATHFESDISGDSYTPQWLSSQDKPTVIQLTVELSRGRLKVAFLHTDLSNVVDTMCDAGVWDLSVAKQYAKQLRRSLRKKGVKISVQCKRYNPLSAFAYDFNN